MTIQCGSIAKTLKDIAAKHKQADLTTLSLISEIDILEYAWTRIKDWSQDYAPTSADTQALHEMDSSFLERLNRSLECGLIVVSALQNDILEYTTRPGTLSFRLRSRVVWNGKALQDHQSRVRGQAISMTLLLKLLDLPSPQNRKQALETLERQLRKSDESAYSIVPSRLSSSFSFQFPKSEYNRESYISLESTDLVYRRLSFENELFTASVYKRNYRNPLIRSLLESGSRQDPSRKKSMTIRNNPLPTGQCLPPDRTEPSFHVRVPIKHLPAHRFGSQDEKEKEYLKLSKLL